MVQTLVANKHLCQLPLNPCASYPWIVEANPPEVKTSEVKKRAEEIRRRLAKRYPGTAASLCTLNRRNPFELLVATILAAQCTDERVNQVTPSLFSEYPDPLSMAQAPLEQLEDLVRPTGFYKNKAHNIQELSRSLVAEHGGQVPTTMEELVRLPGVGRKTANVLLSVAFDQPGFPVDTHVKRVAARLGLTANKDPDKIEMDLNAITPPKERGAFSARLILHGRETCHAKKPECDSCILADICPSAFAVA